MTPRPTAANTAGQLPPHSIEGEMALLGATGVVRLQWCAEQTRFRNLTRAIEADLGGVYVPD